MMRIKRMVLFLVLSALSLTVSAQDNSVLDIIVSSNNHNTLEAVVVATELDIPLGGEGPFTVFAPTDAAFANLPAGAVDELLNDIPFATDILVHHLVGDFVLSSDFSDGQELSTLLGYDLTVTVNSNAVFIDNAMITFADIVADNGVVHVIDAVLIPPSPVVSDDLPWVHDCNIENCDSWTFDNGSDIFNSPWEGVDLNFECSLDGPAGPYNQWAGGTGDFTAASPMNSTSAENGLLIIDSDLFGADANYSAAWIENSWIQTATPINCSATENVKMSFQTRYRCWDNGSSDDSEKCLVEISRDGVNWPSINTFAEIDGTVDYGDGILVPSRWEVFPGYETGSESDNPSFIDLDISSAAGAQEEVWIRFRWSGTWGYSWEIDDIMVSELPENDIRIETYVSTTDFQNTGQYELGAIAQDYSSPFQAGARVRNVGLLDQTGVKLNLSIDGVLVSESSPTTVYYGDTLTLQAPYSIDNIFEIGFHEIEFEVDGDMDDANPSDNFASRSIEITEHQMGRDNGHMTSAFPQDATDDFLALNPFVFDEDIIVYGVDVAFVDGSQHGAPIVAHLFDPSDGDFLSEQYGGIVNSSDVKTLASDVVNDGSESSVNWYTITFDSPLTVQSGTPIAAAVEAFGGAEVQIWEAQYTLDNTSFVYGPFGSGSAYDWYYTNDVPMIRLNLDPDATSTVITGCTYEDACNYDPNAEADDGSCEYESCAGCMDVFACNFDSDYSISVNEECIYPGCTDPLAINYDSDAGCPAECVYLTFDCSSVGNLAWTDEPIGIYPDWQDAMVGVDWSGEWVFNIPEMVEEPQSGVDYGVHHVEWTSIQGLPEWVESSEYELGDLPPSSQHCIVASGIPTESGLSQVTATGEVFISIFGAEFSIGEQVFTAFLNVVDNPNPIPGCMYATAMNYLSYADYDDGSCLFAGCTDESAGNYSPLATIDDGSCGEPCSTSGESSCATDVNYDGAVNVSDLLLLLSDFGANCE